MMSAPYLAMLAARLAGGAGRLDLALTERHAEYILALQHDNGGWGGRLGEADPYYTGFALRSLMLLSRLDAPVAHRAGEFCAEQLKAAESRIQSIPTPDLFSLLSAGILLGLLEVDCFTTAGVDSQALLRAHVEAIQRDDGYAKTARGSTSTYNTFLVMAIRELLGDSVDEQERVLIREMVASRQREDGGFVETPAARHGGTNPTAAAVALLKIVPGAKTLSPHALKRTVDFLLAMRTAPGGFRAAAHAPVPDLLSTATACIALADLQQLGASAVTTNEVIELAQQFARSLQHEGGGFVAGNWDQETDVEYTFYGLTVLSLQGQGNG